MRKGNEGSLLEDNNGRFLGVSLGADYCAEHEWGIKGLQKEFGFDDPEKFGLARRKITRVSPLLRWAEVKTKVYRDGKNKQVTCVGLWVKGWDRGDDAPTGLEEFFGGSLWTGWSERDFGVFSYDAAEAAKLRELYDSMLELDVAIWLGGGGVFRNAGLSIAIASRLPTETTELWDKYDREHKKLKEDVAATGIEYRLKAAGLRWFALSPKRQKDGSIMFWLNPEQQHKYESCWATMQDLEDWIAGKGKVIKPENRKRNTR